jgi:hypothetical protein
MPADIDLDPDCRRLPGGLNLGLTSVFPYQQVRGPLDVEV